MAYINFKEEKAKTVIQLEKRKENNKKICSEQKKNKPKDNNSEKYSFKVLNNVHFGSKDYKNEDEFKVIPDENIECTVFEGCTFSNVKFKNCNFSGCRFVDCKFNKGGVVFEDCIFLKETGDNVPNLNKRINFSCEFYNCKLYAKFINSNCGFLIFDQCNLKDTAFETSDLRSIIIINSELNAIKFKDSNLSGIKVLNTYIMDLEFTDDDKSKLDEKSFFDKITLRKNTKEEYEGIYMVYETLANKFKENSLNNNFGEYYYICNIIKRKSLKPMPKFTSYLYYISCGYGERPIYSVITSLCMIIIFAILYLILGLQIDGKVISYGVYGMGGISIFEFLSQMKEAITVSVSVFGGVGVNDTIPVGYAYILTNFEILFGVIMMGIGIGTITRKLVR
ncbi:Uncharacterized protein YjbI, contains pentapeptide repeats [Clostridium cavendishii DSM 21758]|uniref:Uncharacterized protein YjbI, contains pentapeptide repeats n=1 Tax=Clostridium cavendishii DSM 21758 TaxID=1121302 RepID=A0A1M6EAW0_9CLOT|nr:pentapeptide repeat-containing protein [Clostridium cavendishii]SHI82595.1 Uncharacterized protein YjbI, contains pentapeptide repeats [Clostridium cavendishii DSM 21758]